MALDEYQQAHTLLGNAKSILLIAGNREIEDVYPSAVALHKFLERSEKSASLYVPSQVPDAFHFLDDINKIENKINGNQEVVISLDVSQNPVQQIRYKRVDSHLYISIVPEEMSHIREQDIHISLAKFKHDLIITLGLDDLSALHQEFERNAQFFYETPIINIDRSTSNERYGEVNLIKPTASSCAEVVSALIRKWDEGLVTKDVATSLLAGIIAATGNFQNIRTKPGTLYEAAYLMEKEAGQQEIVQRLFKTKPFELLRLCGIAMAKLQYREDVSLAWLSIAREDFEESGSNEKMVLPMISELKNNFGQAQLIVIFWEEKSISRGITYGIQEEKLNLIHGVVSGERQGNTILFDLPSNEQFLREKTIEEISRALAKFAIQ